MPEPMVGEIRMFAGSFPPAGWALCNGSPMPISENEVLFQVIGTTYGGDGESTFNLPNLGGRIPVHNGNGPDGVTYVIGESAGTESVTLTTQQIPVHNHPMIATADAGGSNSPQSNIPAQSATIKSYFETTPGVAMAANMVQPVGGSQPHENCQPFLVITFIIALFGVFPSPN